MDCDLSTQGRWRDGFARRHGLDVEPPPGRVRDLDLEFPPTGRGAVEPVADDPWPILGPEDETQAARARLPRIPPHQSSTRKIDQKAAMTKADRPGAIAFPRPEVVGVALDFIVVTLLELSRAGTVKGEHEARMGDLLLADRPGGRRRFPILSKDQLRKAERFSAHGPCPRGFCRVPRAKCTRRILSVESSTCQDASAAGARRTVLKRFRRRALCGRHSTLICKALRFSTVSFGTWTLSTPSLLSARMPAASVYSGSEKLRQKVP